MEILIAKEARGKALKELEDEARRRGVRVGFAGASVLSRLVGGERHQGVVARVPAPTYADFSVLLAERSADAGYSWILALDGITDPQNFGALIRTAEGMGVRDLLVAKDRSVALTPSVVKASAGAASHVRVYRVTNLRRALVSLKECGHWVVGLDAGAGEAIGQRDYPAKLVVVLGNEGTGIRPIIREECDFIVFIPMSGQIASFNVGVSGAIFLYELLRQKQKKMGTGC